MKEILIVVDIQKDFVDGALGTKEAQEIVPNAVEKIRGFEGDIIVTLDTHSENYLDTNEGKHLPVPHCIKGTDGWELDSRIKAALENKKYVTVEKLTFGSVDLPALIPSDTSRIELIGLCTDICVVSNALLLKASFPELDICVDARCCAGVTPATHNAALETMRMCQIEIKE